MAIPTEPPAWLTNLVGRPLDTRPLSNVVGQFIGAAGQAMTDKNVGFRQAVGEQRLSVEDPMWRLKQQQIMNQARMLQLNIEQQFAQNQKTARDLEEVRDMQREIAIIRDQTGADPQKVLDYSYTGTNSKTLDFLGQLKLQASRSVAVKASNEAKTMFNRQLAELQGLDPKSYVAVLNMPNDLDTGMPTVAKQEALSVGITQAKAAKEAARVASLQSRVPRDEISMFQAERTARAAGDTELADVISTERERIKNATRQKFEDSVALIHEVTRRQNLMTRMASAQRIRESVLKQLSDPEIARDVGVAAPYLKQLRAAEKAIEDIQKEVDEAVMQSLPAQPATPAPGINAPTVIKTQGGRTFQLQEIGP